MGKLMRIALVAGPLAVGAVPAAAQSVYRAGGAEPIWRVTIDARTMRFEEQGRRPIIVARPIAQTSAGGDRYVARGLIVDTTRARCSLGNNDRIYRDMVIVEVGGRTLRGCGTGATGTQMNAVKAPSAQVPSAPPARSTVPVPVANTPPVARPAPTAAPPPPQGTPLALGKTRPVLANTRWTVWKMRGTEIRTAQPLTVNFTATQIEGQLCNRFRGGYTLTGERLQAGAIAATRMACQGPAMTAETVMFALLRQATRATISSWGTLTLGSGRDTIMLRPAR